MRILILTQFFDPEPASIPGLSLANWLADRGHQVEVVTGFPNYPGGKFYPNASVRIWRREQLGRVTVNRVILYPSHDRSAVRRILNYLSFALSATILGTLATHRADVTYVYHPPATIGLPAMLWKRFRRIPFVLHVQDLWPDSVMESGMVGSSVDRHTLERAITAWCSLLYRSASAIAVLSPGFRSILCERGVAAEKIAVVPNWAEESIFFPLPRDEVLAEELGLTGKCNLIYSGHLGYYQGLDIALRAADRLRDLADFQLVIVGTGQAEASLRRLADDLALENVLFLGRRPYREMAPLTALADILLVSLQDLPFFEATIPSKTQVALACARPILMAVRGDAAAMATASGAGLACTPGDVDAFETAVRHLIGLSEDERTAMGERGRAYYLEHLSLEHGASQLESLMTQACGGGRAASGAQG